MIIKNTIKLVFVGLGGTGNHIINNLLFKPEYLDSHSNINLILIDRDVVEASNLGRQILYSKTHIGINKASIVKSIVDSKFKASNIRTKALFEDLHNKNIHSLLKDADLIVECTDNISARLLINDYCKKYYIPWVSTAAIQNIGQVIAFTHTKKSESPQPCYSCILGEKYGEVCDDGNVNITVLDNLGKFVSSIIASFIKSGSIKQTFVRLSDKSNATILNVKNRMNCQTCKSNFIYLDGKNIRSGMKLCSVNRYMFDLKKKINLLSVKKCLIDNNVIKSTKDALITDKFTILTTGKILISADSLKDARKIFDRQIGI